MEVAEDYEGNAKVTEGDRRLMVDTINTPMEVAVLKGLKKKKKDNSR